MRKQLAPQPARARIGILAVAGLCLTTAAAAAQDTRQPPVDQLTPAERRLAVELVSHAIDSAALRRTGPLYLIAVALVRDKEAEERGVPIRRALVTHYRYDGDVAILTTVDLTRRAVTALDTVAHLPVRLTQEEFARARTLALADARVTRALEPHAQRVEVEALVTRSPSREDPLFGHRVVTLLFRVGERYVADVQVIVDLTVENVSVQRVRAEP